MIYKGRYTKGDRSFFEVGKATKKKIKIKKNLKTKECDGFSVLVPCFSIFC